VYVERSDVTHTIAVHFLEENVVLGMTGTVDAAAFAVGWPPRDHAPLDA
jgi:hypothetical protein